jgi:hypothetical protein
MGGRVKIAATHKFTELIINIWQPGCRDCIDASPLAEVSIDMNLPGISSNLLLPKGQVTAPAQSRSKTQ